ncbi:hypothetical protein Rhe02_88350 [Rhizocola hellebori]|uniref:Uncharacterized protein n=1 Tax=Rhizocola hellebori TaxID=1392758 RepID=A0A8J3VM19_9ACTN|nr:hypothetical protein [Rhizocola hellebori]GIH10768.1 hypothetical protein Rhe02_88350 [Rhizocola hellebori]
MSRRTGKPARQVDIVKEAGLSGGQLLRLASGLVIALAIGLLVGWQVGRPTDSEAAITTAQKADAQRDAQQIVELTATARVTQGLVTPIVTGLAATAAPSTESLAAWKQVMLQETQRYAETVSGGTATNVARGALRSAVNALANALETYTLARTLPAAQQAPLLELAAKQRMLAVTTWSVAATQLDQLNVDAGHGHQHVYLNTSPDGGAMTPDGSPEGKG